MVLRVPSRFKLYLGSVCTFLFLFGADAILPAQGYILISDSLAAHAEILDVYFDNLSGKNPKFTIGDYTVLSERGTEETYYHTKNTLGGAKTKTEISKVFSFVVVSPVGDTALATAEDKSTVQTYYPNVLFPNFPLESITDQKSNSFTTWIILKGDSAVTWMSIFRSFDHPENLLYPY